MLTYYQLIWTCLWLILTGGSAGDVEWCAGFGLLCIYKQLAGLDDGSLRRKLRARSLGPQIVRFIKSEPWFDCYVVNYLQLLVVLRKLGLLFFC